MIRRIIEAFAEVCDGFSADRVIADPDLNARFIDACRRLELKAARIDLNLRLLNIRKRAGLRRSTRRTILRNHEEYSFASEIAIRSLERKYQTTLDRVLCDPELAREFDRVAEAMAPGFTSLEYRWAALRLRKTNRLKPEIVGRVVPALAPPLRPFLGYPRSLTSKEFTSLPAATKFCTLVRRRISGHE